MTKKYLLSSLILPLGLALSAAELPDQVDTTALHYELEGVAVTGSRVPLAIGKGVRMVTVLEAEQIATTPAMTINDILKYASAVDVRQRGPFGMQTDVSIRGGNYNQITILLNGVNICDPQTGHNAFDLPVDMSEIERIEVIEGPAGRIYGTSSLLGAVNIVTKQAAESGISAHVEGGSFGTFDGGISINHAGEKVNNQLSASYMRSDGYSRNAAGGLNSDFDAAKLFWQSTAQLGFGKLSAHAGLSNRDFGSNTFYSARYDDQFEHTFKTYTAITLETDGKIHFKPSVYWNRSQDRFELFRGSAAVVPFNHHRTSVAGVNMNAWFETSLGRTSFGAEVRNEDIISTNLGEPLANAKPVSGYDSMYKCGLNRTDINLFFEHNVILPRLTASAGLSAAKNTGNNAGLGFYPSADASYRISDALKLYASYGSSLRMPTFTELYYSVGGHLADKNLRAERMQSLETGLKYRVNGISASASVWYNHGSDLIDWIKNLNEGPDADWKSVNYSQINALGEELNLVFDVPAMLGRRDAFVQNIRFDYAHISQDYKHEANIQSTSVLEYLRNKLSASADLHIAGSLFMHVSARWMDRKGNYELFENKVPTGRTVDFTPYTLVDAKLYLDRGDWNVYLAGDNLLNLEYHDFGNIPQPGIWVRCGAAFRIKMGK